MGTCWCGELHALEGERRLRAERDRYRETLEKIAHHATATTGVPDRDKLVGIAQEVRRALDA